MTLGSMMTLPSTALRATARVLRLLADTGDVLAAALSGAARQAPGRDQEPATATAAAQPDARAVVPDPVDIATMASWTAPQVIAAIDSLSTTELAELHEHESRRRRRRTVLDAIERAAAPPADATSAIDDDVRVTTERVYSTQTPVR